MIDKLRRKLNPTPEPEYPKVSVVLPNYNGSAFLKIAVDSVLAQSFTDFELIVVEDGSTDGSAELLASYSDPRLRVIPLEQNEHICVALNTGLAAARGKYIARIDSDDCWLPEKLEKQYRYMEQITDDTLVAAFKSDFLQPEAATHEELLCERAFLLLKTDCFDKAGKLAGVDMLAGLIDAEPTRRILREKYGFTQHDLYKLTASAVV